VGVPANAVISQQIALPAHLPRWNMKLRISMNLGRYFPGVNDNLYFDFLPAASECRVAARSFLVAARTVAGRTVMRAGKCGGLRADGSGCGQVCFVTRYSF